MLDNNPYIQFRNWVDNAIRTGIPDATAMALSTATADGKPSSRIVLLKDVEADGLVFFTNYESRKALQIRENPYGALLFFWPDLERQIRVEGKITRVPSEKSDEYYYSRPQGGRIGAWASPQSKKIPGREYLEKLQEDYTSLFKSKELPRPAYGADINCMRNCSSSGREGKTGCMTGLSIALKDMCGRYTDWHP
jgi:pyridoxamine 5'-phosphate oxidase